MSDDELRQRYKSVLIAHQRLDIGHCRCGWGVDAGHVGRSHAAHVTGELFAVRDEDLRRHGDRVEAAEGLRDHYARQRDQARAGHGTETLARLAAERKLAAVRDRHVSHDDDCPKGQACEDAGTCRGCDRPWPCPTVRILDETGD